MPFPLWSADRQGRRLSGPWLASPLPAPSSSFRAANSLSTCDVAVTLSSSFWMSSTGVLRSLSAPEASNSSMAPARACMLAILSWARCMAWPELPMESEIPETASPTLVWASAAV